MSKVTPFLMFNDQLEAAIDFYTATFPDSEIKNVARTGTDGPITSAEFVVGGQALMELINDPNPKKVKAVMDAMLEMIKLDVAELEKAYTNA